MKLSLDTNSTLQRIEHYTAGQISVNGMTFSEAILVTPELVMPWEASCIDDLNEPEMAPILALQPELLLIGSGDRQRFPSAKLLAKLIEGRFGVEVMDTAAACRTYNLLAGEERRIVAALLPIQPADQAQKRDSAE